MDILTHTLSGIAVGTVISNASTSKIKDKLPILFLAGFGAALPDLDAISLWSGFDAKIGHFFNLKVSGKEIYSGKYWFSHHAFLHSAAAAILLSSVIGLFIHLKHGLINGFARNIKQSFIQNRHLILAFFLGFLIHLFEDMPTPASTWGGVNFFWPFKTYIGGTGHIWWWNNYDIFLIVVAVIIINLNMAIVQNYRKYPIGKVSIGVFLIGLLLSLYQIKTRNYNFAYEGHTPQYAVYENKSKEIQKKILGETIFHWMEQLDKKLPVYF